MRDSDTGGNERQEVVGHLWWGSYLEVAVYDARIGRTFRVQFDRAIDGRLKHSGGGGYQGVEEGRFDLAEETAAEWVTDEFGYKILDKEEWSRTKSLRGMRFRDREEISKLSDEERRELARRLRSGEIVFNSSKSDGNDRSLDTGNEQ